MKQTFFSAALVAALTLPAFAGTDMAPAPHDSKDMKDMKQMAPATSDAGFYVAAYGGAQFDTDYGNNRETLSAGGGNVSAHQKIHSSWGGVGGIKAGYNFESFPISNFMSLRLQPAVEAEALYIGDNSHADSVFTPGENMKFSSNSGDFFLNGILRFKNSSIVTPYIGLGVGGQYLTQHATLTGAGGAKLDGLDTSDFDFAVQGLFGIDVAITEHVSLFTEYKFIDAFGTDAKNSNVLGNATYRFKPDEIEQNLITAGVKYSF